MLPVKKVGFDSLFPAAFLVISHKWWKSKSHILLHKIFLTSQKYSVFFRPVCVLCMALYQHHFVWHLCTPLWGTVCILVKRRERSIFRWVVHFVRFQVKFICSLRIHLFLNWSVFSQVHSRTCRAKSTKS